MKEQPTKSKPRKPVRRALAPARQAATAEPRAEGRTYFGVNWVLLAGPDPYGPRAGSKNK